MPPTWLAHPLTRGLDIDSPETTQLRRRIIQEKPFLRRIYQEWYRRLATAIPQGQGAVLELGSGAGFLREHLPEVITSEVFPVEGVDRVVDAYDLPFADGSLRAIVMTNVFHHLGSPRRFLDEASRCVRAGGRVVMLEPWNTWWARWVYTRLHHEPFEPAAPEWGFVGDGPLSDANGALPWIVFARDRQQFEQEYPQWKLAAPSPLMPFRYLLSGGVSLRSLMPGWSHGFWKLIEGVLTPAFPLLAMFALITLERKCD